MRRSRRAGRLAPVDRPSQGHGSRAERASRSAKASRASASSRGASAARPPAPAG
jgi:hypothetical protein